MLFNRKIQPILKKWAESPNRKPLVLRGARQVGKTTVVNMFAKEFDNFIPLNLDLAADRKIFSQTSSIEDVIEALFFLKGIPRQAEKRTLIFIDEIQKSPEAVALLRYFFEKAPHLYVIAAGSLLETMLDKNISFPVGRVEFLVLHPFSFEEFLGALGEKTTLEIFHKIPTPMYAQEKLYELFKRYLLVGGMPEAVKNYVESNDLTSVDRVHESLFIAYLEDVEKYAPSQRMAPIIRHIIQSAFSEVGGRIRYEGFGNSNYHSRDIKEAFSILQKAFLFYVIHPVTTTSLPLIPDTKKSPRLHSLDTGLVVFKTGVRKMLYASSNISAIFSGKIVEHLVGQELFAMGNSPLDTVHFWARDKSQSNAEVDFVIPIEDKLIPVEVKSGASGRLRSLHAFLDASESAVAVRLYSGSYSVETHQTIQGKSFQLVNVPVYHTSLVPKYLEQIL